MDPLLVDVEEAARLLSVGVYRVHRLIDDGELPTVSLGERLTRIRTEDLLAYVAGLETGPRKGKGRRMAADAHPSPSDTTSPTGDHTNESGQQV